MGICYFPGDRTDGRCGGLLFQPSKDLPPYPEASVEAPRHPANLSMARERGDAEPRAAVGSPATRMATWTGSTEIPDLDDLVELYLTESLQSFNGRCYLATSVMLGVAADEHSWSWPRHTPRLPWPAPQSWLKSSPRSSYFAPWTEFRKAHRAGSTGSAGRAR